LGIAPVIVAAVPLAGKLIGSIIGLFKKKPKQPSAADLQRAQNYFDSVVTLWAKAFEVGNADSAERSMVKIRNAGAIPGGRENPVWREYADVAMTVINDYLSQNPSRTVKTSSGAMTKIGVDTTQNTLVPVVKDGKGYWERIDVATGEKIGAVGSGAPGGGTTVFTSGVLGSAMPILIGGAVLFAFAAITDRKR
jgi:hypothetical protein